MADAVCGPSNALQNFQKHTSTDRTLQQDRQVTGRRPEQVFRSIGPAAGILDAEFHAFQAPQIPSVPLQRAQLPLAHVTRYATPPLQVLPDWASDFQNLNVSESRSNTAAKTRNHPSTALQGGWHTEFMNQRDHTVQAFPSQSSPLQPLVNQWQPQYQGQGAYGGDAMYAPNMQQIIPQQMTNNELQFDDNAFTQAFDAVTEDIQKGAEFKGKERAVEEFSMDHACIDPGDVLGEFDFDQVTQLQNNMKPSDTHMQEEAADLMNKGVHEPEQNLPRIGADTIAATSQSEAINPQIEADELSRTAGHLLDTLKDEKNTKFQQSSFLALMRQLRDKEVKVDGDKMVPVVG